MITAACAVALTACGSSGSPTRTATATSTARSPVLATLAPLPSPAPLTRPTPSPDNTTAPPAFTFVDDVHGWAGIGTRLLATVDGGRSWSARATLPALIDSLDFTSALDGWAGTDGGLFSSHDGGATWTLVNSLARGLVRRVDFANASAGWVREGARLLTTTDGGRSWNPVGMPCHYADQVATGAFSFVSARVGFSLCPAEVNGPGFSFKQLYRSDDAGRHWQLIAVANLPGNEVSPSPLGGLPAVGYATDLFFLDEQHGWMSETRGFVFATSDAGRTWNALAPVYPPDEFVTSVVFVSQLRGYAMSWPTPDVTGTGVYREVPGLFGTSDGGKTWTPLCVGDFLACKSRS